VANFETIQHSAQKPDKADEYDNRDNEAFAGINCEAGTVRGLLFIIFAGVHAASF
jgi:hypothetical protein